MLLGIPLFMLIGYVVGSIPFGYLLSKFLLKTDIRDIGSGNIGATNVLRAGNKKLALLTLLLDAAKGIVPIVLIVDVNAHDPAVPDEIFRIFGLSIGLGAILGHCFPIWLKFKGGKGVATAFGVLLAAVPLAALVSATTWGIVAGFFRISSAAALSAAAIAPLVTLLIYGSAPAFIVFIISALVIIRHKDNIKRLMKGEESKIGQKSKAASHPDESQDLKEE